MNYFVLGQAGQALLDNPNGYNQHEWDCETTACIAGWVGRVTDNRLPNRQSVTEAEFDLAIQKIQKILKLDDCQWERLVYWTGWPEPFRFDYMMADDPVVRATVAAKRIRHFMATNGAE